jgi:hypothetical protein
MAPVAFRSTVPAQLLPPFDAFTDKRHPKVVAKP